MSTSEDGRVSPRLLHAVSVTQPVQSWTVIRDHVDFLAVGNVLSAIIGGLPPCPPAPDFESSQMDTDLEEIVKARNAAQQWLGSILMYPGARESPAVRQFLCYGANIVPPQFEGVRWVPFSSSSSNASVQRHHSEAESSLAGGVGHSLDDLQMDDMFAYEEGGGVPHDDDEGDYDDEDADYFSATERYQPTEEAITQDDVMEIQKNADDVEMIEDVGSLAQSLGASHLGRSLQLQAQLANMKQASSAADGKLSVTQQPQQGLNIGDIGSGSSSGNNGNAVGGIGNAVEKASRAAPQSQSKVEGLGDSFNQTKPISAPRLDSFNLIKVIGKGSFGELCFELK